MTGDLRRSGRIIALQLLTLTILYSQDKTPASPSTTVPPSAQGQKPAQIQPSPQRQPAADSQLANQATPTDLQRLQDQLRTVEKRQDIVLESIKTSFER